MPVRGGLPPVINKLASTHEHKYCTLIEPETPRKVKTILMKTMMIPMDNYVTKKIKRTIKQLVIKPKKLLTSHLKSVSKTIKEEQKMVASTQFAREFDSVKIRNTIETACEIEDSEVE